MPTNTNLSTTPAGFVRGLLTALSVTHYTIVISVIQLTIRPCSIEAQQSLPTFIMLNVTDLCAYRYAADKKYFIILNENVFIDNKRTNVKVLVVTLHIWWPKTRLHLT